MKMNTTLASSVLILYLITNSISITYATDNKEIIYSGTGLYPLYYQSNFIGKYETIIVDESGIIYAANKDFMVPYNEKQSYPNKPMPYACYFSQTGKEIEIKIKEKYIDTGPFNSNRAKIKVDGTIQLVGYIDSTGEWAIKPSFLDGQNFKDGYSCVKSIDGKWGVIDKIANWVLNPDENIASISNLGFGIFQVFTKTSPKKSLYYNANTSNYLEWAKNVSSVDVWNDTTINYNGKTIIPVLFTISEERGSAIYNVDGKIVFSQNLYPGLIPVYGSLVKECQLLLADKVSDIDLQNKSKRMIRYLDIITGKLSPSYVFEDMKFTVPYMGNTFNYIFAYKEFGGYFPYEQRTSNYYSIYNHEGQLLLDHLFTSISSVRGYFASVLVGPTGRGLVDLRTMQYVLPPMQDQLKPISNEKWYIFSKTESFIFDTITMTKSYTIPNIPLLWTNGVYSIGPHDPTPGPVDEYQYSANEVISDIGYINTDRVRLRSDSSITSTILAVYPKGKRLLIKEIKPVIEYISGKYGVWMNVNILKNDDKREYSVENTGWVFGAFVDILGPYQQ